MTHKKPVILVIDDQVTVIRVMERMLGNSDSVMSARSEEEVLVMARDNFPDLIL
ncbi:MAG: CheY-like chemotaxis protein [Flavobacterium sp.]|jgi:CheY-like chemotaxis protein